MGYLASETSKAQGLGSSRCPWLIRMRSGQRIQLTMFNLIRSVDVTEEGAVVRHPDVCYEFAIVREEGIDKSLTACGNEDRQQVVYVSRTNEIYLQFASPNILQTLGALLLKYEGNTIILMDDIQ